MVFNNTALAQVPTITSFSPTSGSVGTTVTITGTNFSTIASNNIVYFGAVRASVNTATSTSLSVTVPAGATYQPISVTTNNLTAFSTQPFTVTFPGNSPMVAASFDAGIDSTTAFDPLAVAIIDLDGDGKADLAVVNNANSPASTFSVLRNTSSLKHISFQQRVDYVIPTKYLPTAIVACDFDGDGKLDIAVTSNGDSLLSIFKNASSPGNITLVNTLNISTDDFPFSVAAADIDGDGKPDIVVSDFLTGVISVYKNTSSPGSISFAGKIDFITALGPRTVSIGDVDGDGKPDVVTSDYSSNFISIFRNTSIIGTITFANRIDIATGTNPNDVQIGDIDGDGKNDLVVLNQSDVNYSVYRNTGSPGNISFAPRVNFPVSIYSYRPNRVSLSDMNGDGKPDLAVTGGDQTSVFQNTSATGSITFNSQFNLYSNSPLSAAAADLDGDGLPDVCVTNSEFNTVSIFRNKINDPRVNSFTASTAKMGDTVTINGANFTTATDVSFGRIHAYSFTVLSSTSIKAVVDSGESGKITVKNIYGSGSDSGFIFAGPPKITSFIPIKVGTGTTVTIFGSNLRGATAVSFGGSAAQSFTLISDTALSAIVGNGASGNVSVTTKYGTASLAGVIFFPPPIISSFSPTGAQSDSSVIIYGSNFSAATTVTFGGIAAKSFIVVSDTSIRAIVGKGASGNVNVTSPYGTGTKSGFTLLPTIVSFYPASGHTGSIINISGYNFTGITSVQFGGINADSFKVISDSLIIAVVGSGDTTDQVTLMNAGGASSVHGFNFIFPPKISSFTPLSGNAGIQVTIKGSGFGSSANSSIVYFGSVKANIVSESSNSITVIVPQTTSEGSISVTANGLTAYSSQPFFTTFINAGRSFNANSFSDSAKAFGQGLTIAADLDGDGKMEIISPFLILKALTVVRNKSTIGNISFASPVDSPSYYLTWAALDADLDGDGKLDLVATNESGSDAISIFRNTSTPGKISFAPRIDYPTDNSSSMPAYIGDIDGDGRPDIVIVPVDTYGDSIVIYRNTSTIGNISFAKPVGVHMGINAVVSSILVGDLDGDGKPELIVSSPTITVLRNTSIPGVISFSPTLYQVGSGGSQFLCLSDLDGDGKNDLVALTGTFNITVFKNQSTVGSLSLSPQVIYTSSLNVGGVAVGDLNGDTKPEIVIDEAFYNKVFVFKNNCSVGTIAFDSTQVSSIPDHHNNITIGDMDGDNKMDLIISTTDDDSLVILRNMIGEPIKNNLCPPVGNTTLVSTISGSSYQWQLSTDGVNFNNLSNTVNYSGTNTSSLQLINIPSSWYGYQYRCIVAGNNSDVYVIKFTNSWVGLVNHAWENPGNWSCGTVPDANTDVIINSGTVVLNSNVTVRSLSVSPGVSLTINPPYNLTVTH